MKAFLRQSFLILVLVLSVQDEIRAQSFQISEVPVPFISTTVSGLAQDSFGNIWIATSNQGLHKFNGDDFKLYSHQRDNPNSVISDRLECLFTDREGYLWVGSFASGLSRLNPSEDTFTNFTHDDNNPKSIRSNAIRRIAEDNDGNVWIATVKGVDYFDAEEKIFKRDFVKSEASEVLSNAHVRTLYLDNSGILWAGASSPFFGEQSQGGLFRIDPKKRTVERFISSNDPKSLNNDIVTAIFEDSRGVFWVGTAGDGLHIMDKELGTFQRLLNVPGQPNNLSRPPVKGFNYALDHIRFIEEDLNGNIWIGTMNNGINVYNSNQGTIQHLHEGGIGQLNLPTNDLWSSLRSRDNLMWIGVWSPGENDSKLLKVDLNPLDVGFTELGLEVRSFVDAGYGSVYMGSKKAIMRVNLAGEMTNIHYFNKEGLVGINHLSKDENGNLWGSTAQGLLFYNPSKNDHKLFPVVDSDLAVGEPLPVNNTAVLTADSILVATNNGVHLFNAKTEKFRKIEFRPDYVEERAQVHVSMIYIDSEENIWVGFGNHGLHQLNRDFETFVDYRFLETVQDGPYEIKENDNDVLFVGNWRSGLKMYDSESDTFTQLIDRNELLKEETSVYGFLFVSDSILWVSTNSGLVEYNRFTKNSSMLDVKEVEEYEVTSREFFTAKNGYSYIGTSYGFIKYKPQDFRRSFDSNAKPKVSKVFSSEENITSLFENKSKLVQLNHNQNDLSFTLNYIDFVSGIREKQLEYKLEGYEKKWRNGSNDEEVFYYKIPTGTYSFQVRKLDNNGEWLQESLDFKILAPWWRRWWAFGLYAIGIGVIGYFFNESQRKRTVRLEREKTRERELAQAKEIEKAYTELKATQRQLIHSEKMASLGELTAGIAHEIQNPLNFVNNFSEVSSELLDEMLDEIAKGDLEEVKDITTDLKQNLEKIVHHGKRAEGIVKGMLLHSRSNSEQKVPTDLNALADEYLRLSYHGLRAKDKDFNAEFKTDFDYSIEKIDLVPQDMGRVFLNLITNAFHAVHDRNIASEKSADYSPLVKVKTEKKEDDIVLSISDNGLGIPEEIKDKIFEPFFTTKDAGKGTGLGLSISYDIIKNIGGEILVNSRIDEGTEFVIILPIDTN